MTPTPPTPTPSRSQLRQLRQGVELAEVLGEGHNDAGSGEVAMRRHMDRVRPVPAAHLGAVDDELLLVVVVLQHRLPAVERHCVGAPVVPVVAHLVLVAGELLAHLAELEAHVVAVLADALRLGHRAAGAREAEVLLEAVAAVGVLADGAVDVSAAALAPETRDGVGADEVLVVDGGGADEEEESEEELEEHCWYVGRGVFGDVCDKKCCWLLSLVEYVYEELFDELRDPGGLGNLYTPGECPSLRFGRDSTRRRWRSAQC